MTSLAIGQVRTTGSVDIGSYSTDPVVLTCPMANDVIKTVVFASWGKPTGTCGAFVKDPTCDLAPASVNNVTTACVGMHTCTIVTTDTAPWGDPCSGETKTLAVQVTCGAP